MRKKLVDEDQDTIRSFYFGEWNRDMDAYRRQLYIELHAIYSIIENDRLAIPNNGWVIELGVNRCQSFIELCRIFGENRCYGFDLENITGHDRVEEVDIRKLERNLPSSLCVNEIGGWKVTPDSRRAAYEWATKNVIQHGVLIEHHPCIAEWEIDKDLESRGFCVEYEGPMHIVAKRIVKNEV